MTKSSMSLFGNAIVLVHEVVPRRRALGNAKANDERHRPRRRGARSRRAVEPVAAAIVLEALLVRLGRGAALVELRRRAEAAIRGAAVEQALRVGAVALEVRALIDDLLVPRQAEPLESLEDRARALVGAARLVGVLDAEEELAAELLGVEPVEERGARAADVEVAGRRRSEAEAGCGCGHEDVGARMKARRSAAAAADLRNGERGIRTLDRV